MLPVEYPVEYRCRRTRDVNQEKVSGSCGLLINLYSEVLLWSVAWSGELFPLVCSLTRWRRHVTKERKDKQRGECNLLFLSHSGEQRDGHLRKLSIATVIVPSVPPVPVSDTVKFRTTATQGHRGREWWRGGQEGGKHYVPFTSLNIHLEEAGSAGKAKGRQIEKL